MEHEAYPECLVGTAHSEAVLRIYIDDHLAFRNNEMIALNCVKMK